MIGKSGYYGKTPTQGDFIQLNLSRGFIDVWDDWLMPALASSKEQLGEQWLDAYLTSPIYLFIFTPGICGETTVMGVTMPSVDSVGRYYPFTISVAIDQPRNPFQLAGTCEWFDEAENLILTALDDDFDRDQFTQSLEGLDQLLPTSNTDDCVPNDSQDDEAIGQSIQIRHPYSPTVELTQQLPDLIHNVLTEYCHAYSLWWTTGSASIEPSLLISQGLPSPEGFTSLLTGQWDQGGWLNTSQNQPMNNFTLDELL